MVSLEVLEEFAEAQRAAPWVAFAVGLTWRKRGNTLDKLREWEAANPERALESKRLGRKRYEATAKGKATRRAIKKTYWARHKDAINAARRAKRAELRASKEAA